MLHCCKCNKSKSPQRILQNTAKFQIQSQETNEDTQQSKVVYKIKQNEQKILALYQQIQLENKNLKEQNESLVNENQTLKDKLTQQTMQSIQFIPESHSRFEEINSQQPYSSFYFHDPNRVRYQSLKKLYDELIREKDADFYKKGTPTSTSFLKDILQQKAEDLELAQEQICKQNDIITQYELKYNQLLCKEKYYLEEYQTLEKQFYNKDQSYTDTKVTGFSEYQNQSAYYGIQDKLGGMIQEALKLSPKKIVIKTVH